jgi:hypothetical protein
MAGFYIKSARLGDADIFQRSFELVGSNSGVLDITLGLNAGEITGVVSDDSGAPLPQARVLLAPDSVLSGQTPPVLVDTVGLAAQDGRYGFATVAPGSYRLFAWADPTANSWADWDALRAAKDKGRPVQIKEGSKITLDARAITEIQ